MVPVCKEDQPGNACLWQLSLAYHRCAIGRCTNPSGAPSFEAARRHNARPGTLRHQLDGARERRHLHLRKNNLEQALQLFVTVGVDDSDIC